MIVDTDGNETFGSIAARVRTAMDALGVEPEDTSAVCVLVQMAVPNILEPLSSWSVAALIVPDCRKIQEHLGYSPSSGTHKSTPFPQRADLSASPSRTLSGGSPSCHRQGVMSEQTCLNEVIKVCEFYGYGLVMGYVSDTWRAKDPKGAFGYGPCFGSLEHHRLNTPRDLLVAYENLLAEHEEIKEQIT